jgi:1-acyl-sn-glycerol-3-phosphate acyltransferase
LQAVDVCFARIYHRLSVIAPQQLPRSGPAILVCNHISGVDPLLIQAVCPRLISWMVAKEYTQAWGMRWIFKEIGAIPVARTGRDLSSTRTAMRTLSDGGILGVFPEGRIETSRNLLPFQTGVALMAMKTGVPVFPACIEGTQRGREIAEAVLRPCVSSVVFGSEVAIDRTSTSREALEAATQKIANAVAVLRDKLA